MVVFHIESFYRYAFKDIFFINVSFFNSTIEGHFSLSTFYELVQRIMEVIELSNKAFMGYNFQ